MKIPFFTRHAGCGRDGRRLVASALFVGAFLYRFLEPAFVNDHFRVLSQARQIVRYGEVPVRDFLDPGIFLQIYTSAALQLLFGYNLLGEALVSILFLSLGAALTFLLAARASGSAWIGLVAAISAVAMGPRLTRYQIVFLPALGLLLCWRYVDRRTTGRLVVVALVTALAFLLRHDQGFYLGVAAGTTLVAAHWGDGSRVLLRRLALYAAVVGVALLPFLAFLQANGGVAAYFRSAVEYIRSETDRQRAPLPAFAVDLSAPLILVEPPRPYVAPTIGVRWAAGLSPAERGELERTYGLTNGRPSDRDPTGRSWSYELDDPSPANVGGLVRDRRVDDTDGLDRRAGRLDREREAALAAEQRVRDTPLLRATFLPGILRQGNAVAWLYWLFVTLPVVALVVVGVTRVRGRPTGRAALETPKILAVALLCLVAQRALLRDPIESRLADAAGPTAILAAWLLGRWLAGGAARSTVPLALRAAAAATVMGITWLSIQGVADVRGHVGRTELLSGPAATIGRLNRVLSDLAVTPPIDLWAPAGSARDGRAIVRYVHECTAPTDRLVVTWFVPDAYFYADRGFSAGQLFWFEHYHDSPEDQRAAIDRIRGDSVPIVISRDTPKFLSDFPLVHDYVVDNYDLAATLRFGEAEPGLRVYVDRRATPSGTYEPLGLPCFRLR